MAPLSPGDTKRTSGCTPRAMRVHAGHTPHASTPEPGTLNPEPASCLTSRQLSACAIASAARCLPTPAGPANNRLGGSVLPATERDSKSISRTWPTTSLKGIVGCYHAPGARLSDAVSWIASTAALSGLVSRLRRSLLHGGRRGARPARREEGGSLAAALLLRRI